VVWHSALPPGLSLSKDGVLEGVPTEAGRFTFEIVVGNELGEVRYTSDLQVNPKYVLGGFQTPMDATTDHDREPVHLTCVYGAHFSSEPFSLCQRT
jgi:hypothetical protein